MAQNLCLELPRPSFEMSSIPQHFDTNYPPPLTSVFRSRETYVA